MAAVDPYDDGLAAGDSSLAFTLRYAVPGLVATMLIAIGALGVGWLPVDGVADIPFVHTLRTDGVGTLVSRASVILGGALLLQAWLVVGGDVLAGHIRDVRRLWGILAIWILPMVFMPPLFSRDAYSYYAQGKLVLGGVDPYTHGVDSIPGWFRDGVDPMWSQAPTPYGPLFLSLSRGVAALVGGDPYLAVIAFRLIALIGVGLLAYYIPRLAFHSGIDASKAVWLGVMNPLVLMHFVAGAHNDALMIGLITAGIVFAIEGKGATGIMVVCLGSMVKPIGLLAIPFVGLIWAGTNATVRQRVVAWVKSLGVTAVTFGIAALAAGVGLGWVRALTTPGEVRTWLSPATALGLASGNMLSWFGLGDRIDITVGIFRGIGMIAAVVILAWLCLKPEGRTAPRSLVIAFIAVVALGPVVQPWYLLWALPLAAATGLSARELRVVLLLVAGFTLYGLWETSASASSLLQLSDGLAMLSAAAAVAIAVSVSPRERALLFGGAVSHGLTPEDPPAVARHDRLVVRSASSG
jgi:hypothetical protein